MRAWTFFCVLPKAARALAVAWWVVLVLRGVPAVFAIATGVLVGAVQRSDTLGAPLAAAGAVFILLQVLSPIHQAISANLGDRRRTRIAREPRLASGARRRCPWTTLAVAVMSDLRHRVTAAGGRRANQRVLEPCLLSS